MKKQRWAGVGVLAVGYAVAPVRAQLTNNLQAYWSFNNPAVNQGFTPDYLSPTLTAQTGSSVTSYSANQYDYLSVQDGSAGSNSTPDWTGGPQSVAVSSIPAPSYGSYQGPYSTTTNVVQFNRDTQFPPTGAGPGGAGNFLNVPASVYQNGPASINGSLTYSVWYNFQTYGYSNGGDYSGDRQFVLESTQNSSFFSSGTTANTNQFTTLSYGLKTGASVNDWTGTPYTPNNNLGSTTYANLYTDTATTGTGTQINFNVNGSYNGSANAVTGGEANQWVNLVAVYNNGSNNGTSAPGTQAQNASTGVGYLVGYIDGVYAGEIPNTNYTTAPNLVSVGGLQIGEYRGGSTSGSARNWNGYIAELAVWNRTLSQSEIDSLQTTPVSASLAAASTLAFTGSASSGIWDTTAANWNGSSGTKYVDGHNVVFDDTDNPSQQNITVNSAVSPGLIQVNTSQNYSFSGSGAIGGGQGLVLTGPGTVTISNNGPNTYGNTFVANGTLNFASSGALPVNQNLTINQGGTVNFSNLGAPQTIQIDLLGVGGNLNLNNNNLNLSNSAIYGGSGSTPATGTISTIEGVGNITGTGNIQANGTVTFYLGTGSLTLANTGTNTWGATNVASGTLYLPSVTEIPVNQNLIIGAGANVTYTNTGPGSTILLPLLSVSGTLNLNNNNLNVSGGLITGSGALGNVIGSGSILANGTPGLNFNAGSSGIITLNNTGANSYGSTTVQAGTLNISGATVLPVDQNLTIVTGAKLVLVNTGTAYSVTVNQFTDSGTMNLSNNSLVIQSGEVSATGTAGSIIGTGAIQNSGGLVFNISGTGGIFKIANTGPNTYGSTNVASGSLTLASVGALPVGQNLTLATGATITASNLGAGNTQYLQVNQLTDNGTMNISNNSLTIHTGTVGATGSIIGLSAGTVTIAGPGTVTFSDTSNNSYGSTNVAGGTLVLSSVGALPVTQNLNIASGAKVIATNLGNPHLLQVNQLTNSGLLDLNNNDLVVHSGTLSAVNTQVQTGYAGGSWNGTAGIISTAASLDSTHLTALGVILNDNGAGTPLYGTSGTIAAKFEGATPADNDVLVKYTYYGDADLNGKVDGTDYSRIDNGYLSHLTGWYNGDFNYDGIIDGSDYTLIDNAFNTQGAQIAASFANPTALATAEIDSLSGTSAVPEPATLGLFGIGAAALLGRRRKLR